MNRRLRNFRADRFAAIGGALLILAGGVGIVFTRDVTTGPSAPDPLSESTRPASADGAAATPQSPLTVPSAQRPPMDSSASPVRFTDVAGQAGVQFVYYGNPSAEHFMTEQNGGGVALFDFDGDGVLDIYLRNGSNFERPAERHGATDKLFRGQLQGSERAGNRLHYVDVTRSAGLDVSDFGMGCAAGDFDNDGFVDLFAAGYGRNRLWHNNGDGTFSEVPLDPRSGPSLWSTSAAFADFDGDGNLDLYVVNYVDYSPDDAPCYSQHNPPVRISCGPLGRTGQPDRLYQNAGDGTFENIGDDAGIGEQRGKGLGLSVADFDGDGRVDVYIANDTTNNLLFRNLGGMRFDEAGLSNGVALNANGVATGGMGVGCGDWDGNGRFDLIVTNFQGEPNDFYANLGPAGFRAANTQWGLDSISRPMLGFGVGGADFDLDGRPDLFVANGHVWDLRSTGLGYQYAMPPQLFRNRAGEHFEEVSQSAGRYFDHERLGRAAAVGDLDNDGDPDLVVTHLLDPVAILRNDGPMHAYPRGRGTSQPAATRLRLIGRESSRMPLGARVEAVIGGRRIVSRVPSGDSFQSSSDPRVILPVPAGASIESIRVHWPGGAVDEWRHPQAVDELTLVEKHANPS